MDKPEPKNCWLCKWYGGVYIPDGETVSKWRNICAYPEMDGQIKVVDCDKFVREK